MKIFDKLKKLKYKHPWDKYYKKDERTIKVPEESLYEYLVKCSEYNLNCPALNYFGNKMSYKSMLNKIDLCARALKSQGVRENDVVTICMANTPEAVIALYAVNKIGAVANMIHPLSAEEEIKYSLESTKSVFLITIDLSYTKVKNIIDRTNIYKTVIVSAADSMPKYMGVAYRLSTLFKVEKPKKTEKYMYWNTFMERGKNYKERVLVHRKPDDNCLILHSGGTTGTPKNIILTNGNINSIMEQAKIIFPSITTGDKFLSVLPLFHCFGLVVCVHAPLCLGATAILIPQFDASRFDKLITKYHPTILPGVPTLFEALIKNKHMENVDLSYVKYVISGGDSLSKVKNEQVNNFLKEHGCNETILQGYGMTETSGPTCIGAMGSDKLGSVGIPLPGNEVKIIEPNTGLEVGPGEVGEICLTGPTVMKGYLDNEEETNNIIFVEDNKRWVHTGDLGYMDEDGVIFFVQRLKRMLIVSGYNVYPSHIEDIIMELPYVENCGVIGVPHPYKVQVPKAYIVLKKNQKATNEIKREIRQHCEKKLAKYMLPKEYEFKESLPKTMIGKVDYKNLDK